MSDPTRTALITGITGQDGSYLAELLLDKGYEVHGIIRRSSTIGSNARLDNIYQAPHTPNQSLFLHYGDVTDASLLTNLIRDIKPDEIYNLAAQSHVRVSFDIPDYTGDVVALGTMRLLEAVRASDCGAKFYQASTSELFGSTPPPQNEEASFHPRSPYAVAKLYSYWAVVNYREAYGIHASNGILFNHESPRRGETFVTRKVTRAVARIAAGVQNTVYMGNLNSIRDWGYAPEYVEGMWRMLQQPEPDDYVLATGEGCVIRDFVAEAFAHVGLDWEKYVKHDSNQERPSEVDALIGDGRKAQVKLGWEATTHWRELAQIMVDADRQLLDDQLSGKNIREEHV